MASKQDIQAKRDKNAKMRDEVKALRRQQATSAASAGRDSKLASLSAEEQSLEAELAALRGSAPAPTPAPPAPPAPADSKNKE